jgi:uncharacterized membrane protein YkvA (DUF1232 family)
MNHESEDRLNAYSTNASEEDVERIGSQLGGMNRGPIVKLWNDVQALWAMIVDPNAAWTSKAIAIGSLLYLVSPLDAIPDLIPVLGLTDDAGVIVAAVSSLCHELTKYRSRNGRMEGR